eukprot:gnl/MRDRNA2_/MRDRNA2_35070_c0_seq1.p1 gnl/MRDRNA2_/MRDRNA2_35070_c0~~gnl/MRDRNA2_/MRDRNA2_35070_c0_seq1.p1  ORF type:complete len:384 (+),score=70.61 gnl/MRDRNA2_/MRDRNA2_35070_c0_seq1:170-1153(+)
MDGEGSVRIFDPVTYVKEYIYEKRRFFATMIKYDPDTDTAHERRSERPFHTDFNKEKCDGDFDVETQDPGGDSVAGDGDAKHRRRMWRDNPTTGERILENKVENYDHPDIGKDEPMVGKICQWNYQKGFGFITPDAGGNDYFVHTCNVKHDTGPVAEGDEVYFILQWNTKKQKYEAGSVRLKAQGDGLCHTMTNVAHGDNEKYSTGVLVDWDPQKGFGFVRRDDGGEDLFLHVSRLTFGENSVQQHTEVRFRMEKNAKNGKLQAVDVSPITRKGPSKDQELRKAGGQGGWQNPPLTSTGELDWDEIYRRGAGSDANDKTINQFPRVH